MSRIDLICKLFSPILFSAFQSAVHSVRIGIITVAALNLLSWGFENWSARRLWNANERLRRPKIRGMATGQRHPFPTSPVQSPTIELSPIGTLPPQHKQQTVRISLQGSVHSVLCLLQDYVLSLNHYFSSDVWIPSMTLSILHFSVLNFSATLTVYLLNSGFSLNLITFATVLSSGFELSSTFLTPWGIRACSVTAIPSIDMTELSQEDQEQGLLDQVDDEARERHEKDDVTQILGSGVVRLGFLGLCEMLLCLVGSCE